MDIQQMRQALAAVRETQRAAEVNSEIIGELFEKAIEHVSGYRLALIKRRLRHFNANTRTWHY